MTLLDIKSCECVAPVEAALGEGPLWDPRIDRLLFLDIKGNTDFHIRSSDAERENIQFEFHDQCPRPCPMVEHIFAPTVAVSHECSCKMALYT